MKKKMDSQVALFQVLLFAPVKKKKERKMEKLQMVENK